MAKSVWWSMVIFITGGVLMVGCGVRTRTYVRIDSEPQGASVYWEGKEVGQTPVMVGEISPAGNVYEVKISKQNYKDYVKLFKVGLAKKPGKRTLELFVQMEPALVDFSLYDTNINLLEKALNSVLSGDKIASLVARGGSIGVVRLDQVSDTSSHTGAIIENVLINFLTRNGYQVVERDPKVLIHIVHEASGNLPFAIMTKHESPVKPFVYDAKVEAEKTIGVNLPTADYILAYAILENGIMYTQPEPQTYRYPSKPTELGDVIEEPLTKRNAKVKLHMRLINAKAGAVIWADTIEGTASDVVPTRFKTRLESPEYSTQ